jgi:hypothetical protein
MNPMHRLLSRRTCMVIFNLALIAFMGLRGRFHRDFGSIAVVGIVLVVMNVIAWKSTKDFPEWK